MADVLAEVKQRIDIVEFIGQYVQLKPAGRNFRAICPFHQEKSPSFVISPDRQIWHCFGSCGIGGDVVSFWMKWENLSFNEAVRELAEIAGIRIESTAYQDQETAQKDQILSLNNLALKFYSYILHKSPVGKNALEYLKERGINEQIMNTFELGYAPASWDSLLKFFQKKNIKEIDLVNAGLIVKSTNTDRYYDRFRNRIMFPLKDAKGNCIGFSGRVLVPDAKSAKYVNSPETPIYRKRETLYGIHLTREAIRKEGNAYIVEGEFDMITPYQHGIENIVAIKGAALTTEQLAVLKRYTNKITLALDADEAGIEAMKRGIREAEKMDFDIHIAQFTIGKDPDEAIRKDFVSFKKDLKKTVPIYDFLITHFTTRYPGDSPFQKKKIAEEMAPYVSHIKNPIVQSHYVKKLANLLEVDERSVFKLLYSQRDKEKRSFRSSVLSKNSNAIPREELIEKCVLSFILQHDQTRERALQIFSIISPDDFSLPALKNVATELMNYIEQSLAKPFVYNDFVATIKPELQPVADELFLFSSTSSEMKNDNLVQLLFDLKRHTYQFNLVKYSKEETPEAEQKVAFYNDQLHKLNKIEIAKQLQTV